MPDQSSIQINDYDGQTGVFGVNSVVLTAVNFAAQMTALQDLMESLAPIIDGVVISRGISHRIQQQQSTMHASNPLAQRGNKWEVATHDNSTELATGVPNPYYNKPFYYEIPTASLDLRVDGNNQVWIQGGSNNVADFDDFITAFQAFAKSPVGGALLVDRIIAITTSGG